MEGPTPRGLRTQGIDDLAKALDEAPQAEREVVLLRENNPCLDIATRMDKAFPYHGSSHALAAADFIHNKVAASQQTQQPISEADGNVLKAALMCHVRMRQHAPSIYTHHPSSSPRIPIPRR